MCIEPRPVSSCPPTHSLAPFPISLRYAHTCLRRTHLHERIAYTPMLSLRVYNTSYILHIYIYIYTRICRTCLNASRIAQPGSVYYFRACAPPRWPPPDSWERGAASGGGGGEGRRDWRARRQGSAAWWGGECEGEARAARGEGVGEAWGRSGEGTAREIRWSAARCTHSRWGIPRRRFAGRVSLPLRRKCGGCDGSPLSPFLHPPLYLSVFFSISSDSENVIFKIFSRVFRGTCMYAHEEWKV